jgi:hypothetical protein
MEILAVRLARLFWLLGRLPTPYDLSLLGFNNGQEFGYFPCNPSLTSIGCQSADSSRDGHFSPAQFTQIGGQSFERRYRLIG